MAITEFTAALNQVASERNIKPEDVLATLKEALVAAYHKDNPEIDETVDNDISAVIDGETGEVKIMREGKDITPAGFGRIASQTAKQVILQKIREAEKESIANEYRELIGTIVQGYIFRIDRDTVIMDIGKTQAIMPESEQIRSERYSVNQKYKVLIKDVREDSKGFGSSIIVSRKDPEFIKVLFTQEVPEMGTGVVKIESIAREAGERTKIAVSSSDPKIDPSGACIGQRGIRVQAVTDELNGEKIDIINYSPDDDKFIASALAPAHVNDVTLDHDAKSAKVKVSEDQLSLAIGKEGQNARLAARLTGWRINIDGSDLEASPEEDKVAAEAEETEEVAETPAE
jgi:N utilization substance protein A